MMSRSLRSNSRWQKLQVQQIKQADNSLRLNINNCTKTSVEGFEQQEFLSLFELIPAKPQNDKHKVSQSVNMLKRISAQRTVENIVKMKKPIRKRKRKPPSSKRTLPPRQLRAPAPAPPKVNDDFNHIQFDTRSKRKITLGKANCGALKHIQKNTCSMGLALNSLSCFVFIFSFVFFFVSANTESYISQACHVQDVLLARRQYLLNELYDAIADHRKYAHLDELEKQRNVLSRIIINEFETKLIFLRDHNT